MPAYTYGYYVYFSNNINKPKEHHNNFTLNQELDFYITSMLKLMDDTFTSMAKLFVDETIKKGSTPISKFWLSYQEF